MTQTNVELARHGWEAALRGDFDAIAQLLDPHVKWHGGDPDDPVACHNRAEALRVMRANWRPRRVPELVEVIGAGDRVVVITRRPGDDALRANVTTFRNGKVIEMIHFPDPDAARAAAGL